MEGKKNKGRTGGLRWDILDVQRSKKSGKSEKGEKGKEE